MTAETVLENVLIEIGLGSEAPQISGTDHQMRQVVKFMNAAGEDIAHRTEWSRLYVDWDVSGNVDSAPLPDDFHKMAGSGAVRIGDAGHKPIRPVVAPEQWEFLYARPSAQHYYHLSGGRLLFSPSLPPAGASVRYVSRNWVEGRDQISQNGDNILIPERLLERGAIWRWKRQMGLPYDDALSEFEADLLAEINADRGGS